MLVKRAYAVIPFLIMSSVSGVNAEVKLDGTLGTGTHGNIAGPDYAIEAAMGKQQGASLFHSFEKFNIGTGESAVFRGPADVERIISRVTGGSVSNIDGLIKSEIQGADFYFINPFGMIFGPNASLDITGSFYATSADYVKLGENGRFDARNPEQTVLTADAPEAFGFLGQKPGDITVESKKNAGIDPVTETPEYTGLDVRDDNRLMIAGGDVKIDGGVVDTHSGNLDIVSVVSGGELDIENLETGSFSELGRVEACNAGFIRTFEGGKLRCQSGSLDVTGGSALITKAQNESGMAAGDVEILARDSVSVSGMSADGVWLSAIGSSTDRWLYSDSGNLHIKTGDLFLREFGCLSTDSLYSGNCGNIVLDVSRLNLFDVGTISSSKMGGEGKAGDIIINASDSVCLSESYSTGEYSGDIATRAFWSEQSEGGNIFISAPNLVIEKTYSLRTESENAGNSGNIYIDVASLKLLEGGWISASISGGSGKAGDVTVNASDSVLVSGFYGTVNSPSSIMSMAYDSEHAEGGNIGITSPSVVVEKAANITTGSTNAGNSGNITFESGKVEVLEGGFVDSSLDGSSGKAGNVIVNASDSLIVSGFLETPYGPFFSEMSSGCKNSENAEGGYISISAPDVLIEKTGLLKTLSKMACNSGDIALDVSRLRLLEGGSINSSIDEGNGEAGEIIINASESVNISGKFFDEYNGDIISQIVSDTKNSELSEAGKISLVTPELNINDHGVLSTSSENSGSSGNISLNISRLNIFDGGCLSASINGGTGKGGDIVINASESVLIKGSNISAEANDSATADAGSISIITPDLILEDLGHLSTLSSEAGKTGKISLDIGRLNMFRGFIDASTFVGTGFTGEIDITASDSIFMERSSIFTDTDFFTDIESESKGISIRTPELGLHQSGITTTTTFANGSSGRIDIDVKNLLLDNGSHIDASIMSDETGKGGDIIINASESVIVSGFIIDANNDDEDKVDRSTISSSAESFLWGSTTMGGDIFITSPYLKFINGGTLDTSSSYAGNSGNISLNVDSLELFDGGVITASIKDGEGRAGDIIINASEHVKISGQNETGISGIRAETENTDNMAENLLSINTPELLIDGGYISTESRYSKNSGDIILDCRKLDLLNAGHINTELLYGSGMAGDISILNTESVLVSGISETDKHELTATEIFSSVYHSPESQGGRIYIESNDLRIEKSSAIRSSAYGDQGMNITSGNIDLEIARLELLGCSDISSNLRSGTGRAGDITINSSESIFIAGSNEFDLSLIYSGIEDADSSTGGTISISTKDMQIGKYGALQSGSYNSRNTDSGMIKLDVSELNLFDGGFIDASIENGTGRAGDIVINAAERVVVSGKNDAGSSRIQSRVENSIFSEYTEGGKINITSDEVKLDNEGLISCQSINSGPAGEISITGDSFQNFSGSVDTTADSSGGGNIFFRIKDFFFMNNGSVATAVSGGEGSGGNISIEKPELSALRESKINASAKGGNGGNIRISSDYFIKDIPSILDASSQLGIAGDIEIDSPDIDLNTGLVRLKGEYNDLTRFLHNPCLDRMRGKISTLTVGPRIARRQNPFAYLESDLN